jgi:hypothetical protein
LTVVSALRIGENNQYHSIETSQHRNIIYKIEANYGGSASQRATGREGTPDVYLLFTYQENSAQRIA